MGVIGFVVGYTKEECPSYWVNFVDYCSEHFLDLFEELEKQNGEYHYSFMTENETSMVTFKTSEDMMIFVLRWT